jgi:hypothetical protein
VTCTLEVLDPRHDPEPPYWRALRTRAGLRADWAWSVLATQAWGMRVRQLITVLHRENEPRGVVAAGWTGLPARRNSFAPVRGGPLIGGLHVRSPGTPSIPGWWLAEGVGIRELTASYAVGMRRRLGLACLGVLLRQVTEADLAGLGSRIRLARPTEPLWTVHTARWGDREEWLRTLSRARRSNLRRVFRTFGAGGEVDTSIQTHNDTDPTRVAELLRHNDQKYAGSLISPAPQLTGYLAELLRQPDVLSTVYTEHGTGRLLGFGTVLDHPEWPVWRHWSMLPIEAGGVRNLYFHHVGTLVDWAISAGKRGVVLGKGKADVKSSLGAEPTKQLAVAVPAW